MVITSVRFGSIAPDKGNNVDTTHSLYMRRHARFLGNARPVSFVPGCPPDVNIENSRDDWRESRLSAAFSVIWLQETYESLQCNGRRLLAKTEEV